MHLLENSHQEKTTADYISSKLIFSKLDRALTTFLFPHMEKTSNSRSIAIFLLGMVVALEKKYLCNYMEYFVFTLVQTLWTLVIEQQLLRTY